MPNPRQWASQRAAPNLQKLLRLYETARDDYEKSAEANLVAEALRSKAWPSATSKAVSLGLGSLTASHQNRRIKQLALFLAITSEHSQISGKSIMLFAQDPTFTKVDEAFLQSLNITILRTSSGSSLGEALEVIDDETLVYTPFLTLEAYKALFGECRFSYMIGDDFNALKSKWPKHSEEKNDVDAILRLHLSSFRRRVIDVGQFWSAEEKPFPLAAYFRTRSPQDSAKPTAVVSPPHAASDGGHDNQHFSEL